MRIILFASLAVLVGCSSSSSSDAGDSGSEGSDAGGDGGSCTPPPDAGAGTGTVGSPCCSDPDCERGLACSVPSCALVACPGPDVNGCTNYEDLTAPNAARSIIFPTPGTPAYSPPCIQILAGQSVSFSGDFAAYPLAQQCGESLAILPTSSGGYASFTFETPGAYGYGNFFNTPIQGGILVVP